MATSGRLAAGTSSSSSSSRPTLAVPSSRSDAAPIRRHSLFGTEDRVVLDIGSRWSKVGFSGEAQPRRVFRTVEAARRPGTDHAPEHYLQGSAAGHGQDDGDDAADAADAALQRRDLLWDFDISRGSTSSSIESRRLLLKARLTVLLRRIYSEYLLTDPATRKVILVENPHMPAVIRETIYEVLFLNLRVQMVAPMGVALLSVFATGCLTGLVVDVGALETRVVPVYHGRPLLTHFASTTRGGRDLERRLRALLLRYGRHILPVGSDGAETSIASRTRKIKPALLTQEMLQEILIKCCFVGEPLTHTSRADHSSESALPRTRNREKPQEDRPPDWQLPHTGDHATISQSTSALRDYDEADDVQTLKELRGRYTQRASAGHLFVPLKPPKQAWTILPTKAVTVLGPTPSSSANASEDSAWPREARGDILVPGWLREHLLDFFWEQSPEKGGSDEEDASIASLLLHTIVGLPIDLRREMIGSVLVTGGYASFPGFPHRVRLELESLLDAIDIPGSGAHREEHSTTPTSGVKISTSLSSTRTATRQLRSSPPTRCILPWRDQVTFSTLKPLREHIAVLNDHLPPSYAATPRAATVSAPSASASAAAAGALGQRGGTAPLIPPLVYSWFGASLAGSLKLASVEAVSREDWETEQRRKRRREAKEEKQREKEREKAKGPRGSLQVTAEGKSEEKTSVTVPVPAVQPSPATAPAPASSLAPPPHPRPGFGATGGLGAGSSSGSSSSSSSSIGEGPGHGSASGKARSRGSFMGVVSGLETGAYGGLATVSRHLNVASGGGGGGGGGPGGGLRSPPLAAGSGSAGGSAGGSGSGRSSPAE